MQHKHSSKRRQRQAAQDIKADGRLGKRVRSLHSTATGDPLTSVIKQAFSRTRSIQMERPFEGLVTVCSLITLTLRLPAQKLVELEVFWILF